MVLLEFIYYVYLSGGAGGYVPSKMNLLCCLVLLPPPPNERGYSVGGHSVREGLKLTKSCTRFFAALRFGRYVRVTFYNE